MCTIQENLFSFLSAGSGELLNKEDIRGAVLLRINNNIKGYSSVRTSIINRYINCLNLNITPCVYNLGSFGASGDLVPLASIGSSILGIKPQSKLIHPNGNILPCLEVLKEFDMEPIKLKPKEGLALVNGTSVSTSIACNVFDEIQDLFSISLNVISLFLQSIKSNLHYFDKQIFEMKKHEGIFKICEFFDNSLKDSKLIYSEISSKKKEDSTNLIQDRYQWRCLPQFLGPIYEDLKTNIKRKLEIEMNAANDNPLIDPITGKVFHTGNFLGQHVSSAMDNLRYNVALLNKLIDVQISHVVYPNFSGNLPQSLVVNKNNINMGFTGLQIAASSICSKINYYSKPIANDFFSHCENFNQVINSESFNSSLLSRDQVNLFRNYISYAILFAVQAVELRAFMTNNSYNPINLLSKETAKFYEIVKNILNSKIGEPLVKDDKNMFYTDIINVLQRNIKLKSDIVTKIQNIKL